MTISDYILLFFGVIASFCVFGISFLYVIMSSEFSNNTEKNGCLGVVISICFIVYAIGVFASGSWSW